MSEYIRYGRNVKVSAQPDARGSYRIRWTDPKTGQTRDARRARWADAEELAFELSEGIMRMRAGRSELSSHPIAHLIEDHIEDRYDRYQPQSLRTHRSYLNAHVVPEYGDITCADWDRQLTEEILARARAGGLSRSSCKSLLQALAGVAKTGHLLGYLDADQKPCAGVSVSDGRRRLEKVDTDALPTPEYVEKAAQVCADSDTPWRALHFHLMAYSGLRLGEAAGVKVGDVDLDAGVISVRRQVLQSTSKMAPPKYESKRDTIFPVWLDELYAARLDEADDEDEPLLPSGRGSHLSQSWWRNRWFLRPAYVAGWPLDDDGNLLWTPHTLRHYFCTWALSKDGLNLDPADVKEYAGHRSLSTTLDMYVDARPGLAARGREASRSAGR